MALDYLVGADLPAASVRQRGYSGPPGCPSGVCYSIGLGRVAIRGSVMPAGMALLV